MKGRTMIVGDPHGCIEEFNELVKLLEYKKGLDRLVIAGDVFDRGPDSIGMLRKLQELGAILVLGNHDEKHLRYAIHEGRKIGNPRYKNPMKPFYGSRLEVQKALTKDDLDFLLSAPLLYRLDTKWVVVHAGMESKPVSLQSKAVLRVRYVDEKTGEMISLGSKDSSPYDQPPNSVYWTEKWEGPESVFYGHNVHSLEIPKLTYSKRDSGIVTVGLDTGCCFGGHLTAAVLESISTDNALMFTKHVQVKAKQAYKSLNNRDSHKE